MVELDVVLLTYVPSALYTLKSQEVALDPNLNVHKYSAVAASRIFANPDVMFVEEVVKGIPPKVLRLLMLVVEPIIKETQAITVSPTFVYLPDNVPFPNVTPDMVGVNVPSS